jgi:hypothetical protein
VVHLTKLQMLRINRKKAKKEEKIRNLKNKMRMKNQNMKNRRLNKVMSKTTPKATAVKILQVVSQMTIKVEEASSKNNKFNPEKEVVQIKLSLTLKVVVKKTNCYSLLKI